VSVGRVEEVLTPDPQSARAARALLRSSLAEWRLSEWYDDAALIVSELVTNGVMHAETTLVLSLRCDDAWLEVSVADDSPWPVRPTEQHLA
jgi:anti-sigma regulatory factor (Ser/Thr protein kinase)